MRRCSDDYSNNYGAELKPRVAVVGAASLIGEALVEELRTRKISCAELHLLDEARYLGRKVSDDVLSDVDAFDFSTADLVFFCGRSALTARYAEAAAVHAWVIDCSGALRDRHDVPMVVADVNAAVLAKVTHCGLIALPGSASVALATVLAPLHSLAGLARVEVVTYQAVSGGGRSAMEELASETVAMLSGRKASGKAFGAQIAFNVIPQIDTIEADGVSREERRLLNECRRVLALPHLGINVTAVRVPVFFGHSLAVHATFERAIGSAEAIEMLRRNKELSFMEAGMETQLTPAALAAAPDRIYVGRLRADITRDRSLNFWVVADNIRKCAAYNALSVAQILVNRPH